VPDYAPFPVELVTPEGAAFDGEAQIVILPGSEGELGILANHAPLIAHLDAGEIDLVDASGKRHCWASDDGFVQVRRNRARILVGAAVVANEVDVGAAEERLERAREALEKAEGGDGDVYRARREVLAAENMVRIGRGRSSDHRVVARG
jgi:F-type H+-transporting ATPase subunit epsilon